MNSTITAPSNRQSGTGDPTAYHAVIDAVGIVNGGATVTAAGLPYAGSGLVVAIPEHGRVITDGAGLGALGQIAEWVGYAAHHVTAPSLRPRYFGAWFEGDTLYLDVVEVFPREEEAEAIAAGAARNQIAIWDAGRQAEIPTGGDGFVSQL